MGITVHVVDGTIANDSLQFSTLASVNPGDFVIKLAAMCNGNSQLINDIKDRCSQGSISRLIIYGHGAPGIQSITGKDGSGVKENSGLVIATLNDFRHRSQWASLRTYFAPEGVIVLRGCNTAQGPKGEALITALAKAVGVPVQASDWYQRLGKSNLLGNVRTAYPSNAIVDDELQGMKNLEELPFLERMLFRTREFLSDPPD